MTLFITRVWGFQPEHWPVITFGLEGNRDRLLKESTPGDRIVFVGTLREPTLEHLRGRLLGMAEIGRIPVDTLDIVSAEHLDQHDYDDAGRFRWPKAIPMVRAWRFTPEPKLLDVLEEQLPYHATSQAVALAEKDAKAVLELEVKPTVIPSTIALENARLLDKALSAANPTTGLRPSSWEGAVSRDVERTSFTYAFRFGNTDIWKIGHAINVGDRLKQVNRHVPTEIVNQEWYSAYQQRWDSETEAYAMEQRVLNALEAYRTEGERVFCSEQELRNAWLCGMGVAVL